MRTVKLLISAAVIFVLILFPSCKGGGDADPEPETETQRVAKLMTGTWKLNSIAVDGVAKSLFANMTITFTSTGFTTVNGTPVWPASGSWSFVDDTAKAIKRDDLTNVSIDAIDDKNLTLSLTWTKTTVGPGRAQAIAGKNVFVFGK